MTCCKQRCGAVRCAPYDTCARTRPPSYSASRLPVGLPSVCLTSTCVHVFLTPYIRTVRTCARNVPKRGKHVCTYVCTLCMYVKAGCPPCIPSARSKAHGTAKPPERHSAALGWGGSSQSVTYLVWTQLAPRLGWSVVAVVRGRANAEVTRLEGRALHRRRAGGRANERTVGTNVCSRYGTVRT